MRLSGTNDYALERSYKRLENCLPRLKKLIDYSSAIDEVVEGIFKEKTGIEEEISKLRDVHEQLKQYLAGNSSDDS